MSHADHKDVEQSSEWKKVFITCIMTTETLVKKLSKGLPSSPTQAMAMPVTMEKTTKPNQMQQTYLSYISVRLNTK
jgi:hypothetical protein